MTASPWRTLVASLTYGGTDLTDWASGIFFDVATGIGEVPTVRGEDTTVPGLPGRVAGNRVNDVLPIELRGHVRAATSSEPDPATMAASYVTNLLAVRALFATDRARASLVATLIDGTILTISALPLSTIQAETSPAEITEYSVTLEGYDDWVVT